MRATEFTPKIPPEAEAVAGQFPQTGPKALIADRALTGAKALRADKASELLTRRTDFEEVRKLPDTEFLIPVVQVVENGGGEGRDLVYGRIPLAPL